MHSLGNKFPPTLCDRVGEAVPLLLNKRVNCKQELFFISLPGYLLHMLTLLHATFVANMGLVLLYQRGLYITP